ncbi:MAG: hypothetical protein KGH59_00015 [Candidatus Micrarchaeota archaeon]|nr:hypothetical protein [Candidatus Micrarchaeota archaeon]MDE1846733.1 hypothetical protein [Candidatus Micrarchaeota archaeon]
MTKTIEVWKEKGIYAARIPFLHVNTQAKTMKELKKNLIEAIEVAVEGFIELEKMQKKSSKAVAVAKN